MFKRIFQLFKIARKLASSGALETINEIYNIPFLMKLFFELMSVGSQKNLIASSKKPGEELCDAFENMGTTFIKLGQFLATRPDIIGEEVSKKLEKLQDRLPPFKMSEAKNILKENIDLIVVDTAHGHTKKVADIIKKIKKITGAPIKNRTWNLTLPWSRYTI